MKKVLFVDDEEMLLEIYESYIKDLGYKVFTATNGEQALEILENNRINVMFFDLKMPGMSGLELCRKVRDNNPIALIYAITGFSTLFELSGIRDAGFDDYFKKPMKSELLIEITTNAIRTISRWGKIIDRK